jgi:glucose-1-phosphatase
VDGSIPSGPTISVNCEQFTVTVNSTLNYALCARQMIFNHKNIIFDFGAVILDIDYNRTIQAFADLGVKDAASLYSQSTQNPLFDCLEKGLIGEKEFFEGLRKISGKNISDNQFRDAWNSLLIGLPEENVRILENLKKSHRLFLLSNTNSIHENAYREMIIRQYGSFILDELFEKIYLSHRLHLRKPDKSIFEYVLNNAQINRADTLFIDDSIQHVNGAREAGLEAVHLVGSLKRFLIED